MNDTTFSISLLLHPDVISIRDDMTIANAYQCVSSVSILPSHASDRCLAPVNQPATA